MEQLSIDEIIRATKGLLFNYPPRGERIIENISTDSRTLKQGDLFIALKGKNFDGHNFVKQAFDKGAKLALVSKKLDIDKPFIKVENTLDALGDIASYYRSKFRVKVVGITGSNGKSTTKEILAHLLSFRFNVVKSLASFNNFVGVPLTIFSINSNTEVLIQEMETNILGGVKRLCCIARPNLGLVTNIGKTHLEFLRKEYNVFREKSELLESLPYDGYAFLNLDDRYFDRLKKVCGRRKIVTFGIENKAKFYATNIEIRDKYLCFILNGKFKINLNTLFYRNVYNALGAISIACSYFGFKLREIKPLLENFTFLPLRFQLVEIKGIRFINDCFNANPDSMREAILAFNNLPAKRKIVILGDMLELGSHKEKFHYLIGKLCGELKIDFLIAIGRLSKFMVNGAKKKNIKNIIYCKNKEKAVKSLVNLLENGDTVLVKASRAMGLEEVMERVIERIKEIKNG
ncbi:MAG: UDP-N-acetylmuramoyl-tripeptide--D-alanyl-D-alanine ligase [Candidatus Omnitrophica bacterium]|nr:UDP-N-acetylmuramoyl-tripeptide--D-alanyl-D-alanine ligase [Candidatus Omnitrophota bacterium]